MKFFTTINEASLQPYSIAGKITPDALITAATTFNRGKSKFLIRGYKKDTQIVYTTIDKNTDRELLNRILVCEPELLLYKAEFPAEQVDLDPKEVLWGTEKRTITFEKQEIKKEEKQETTANPKELVALINADPTLPAFFAKTLAAAGIKSVMLVTAGAKSVGGILALEQQLKTVGITADATQKFDLSAAGSSSLLATAFNQTSVVDFCREHTTLFFDESIGAFDEAEKLAAEHQIRLYLTPITGTEAGLRTHIFIKTSEALDNLTTDILRDTEEKANPEEKIEALVAKINALKQQIAPTTSNKFEEQKLEVTQARKIQLSNGIEALKKAAKQAEVMEKSTELELINLEEEFIRLNKEKGELPKKIEGIKAQIIDPKNKAMAVHLKKTLISAEKQLADKEKKIKYLMLEKKCILARKMLRELMKTVDAQIAKLESQKANASSKTPKASQATPSIYEEPQENLTENFDFELTKKQNLRKKLETLDYLLGAHQKRSKLVTSELEAQATQLKSNLGFIRNYLSSQLHFVGSEKTAAAQATETVTKLTDTDFQIFDSVIQLHIHTNKFIATDMAGDTDSIVASATLSHTTAVRSTLSKVSSSETTGLPPKNALSNAVEKAQTHAVKFLAFRQSIAIATKPIEEYEQALQGLEALESAETPTPFERRSTLKVVYPPKPAGRPSSSSVSSSASAAPKGDDALQKLAQQRRLTVTAPTGKAAAAKPAAKAATVTQPAAGTVAPRKTIT